MAATGGWLEWFRNIDTDIRLGYKQSRWQPGFRDDVFELKAEGLSSYNAGLSMEFKSHPVLFLDYEGPIDSSPAQGELFELNKDQEAALRKLQLGVLLSWIPQLRNSDKSYLVAIGNTRYLHTEETYFGDATAVVPFAYVPKDVDILWLDEHTVRFFGIEVVEPGSTVAFRTQFTDDEISVAWPLTVMKVPFLLRLGYFATSWYRPSDLDRNWLLVADDTLMIYETKFTAQGVIMGIEPRSRDVPGLNASITGRWGFDNNISNRVDRDYEIEEGKELLFASGVVDVWYNWQFQRGKRFLVACTVGAMLDQRSFATEIHPLRGTWEKDDLLRFYSNLRVKF